MQDACKVNLEVHLKKKKIAKKFAHISNCLTEAKKRTDILSSDEESEGSQFGKNHTKMHLRDLKKVFTPMRMDRDGSMVEVSDSSSSAGSL